MWRKCGGCARPPRAPPAPPRVPPPRAVFYMCLAMRQCRAEGWAPTMAILKGERWRATEVGRLQKWWGFLGRLIRFCGVRVALCAAPVPAPVLPIPFIRKCEHKAWRSFYCLDRAGARGAGQNSKSTTIFQPAPRALFRLKTAWISC
jgi:hypothetical protein